MSLISGGSLERSKVVKSSGVALSMSAIVELLVGGVASVVSVCVAASR